MMPFLSIILIVSCIISEGLANLPPVFSTDLKNLAISEKTPIGSVIYTLEAFDPENDTIHFSLEGTDTLKVDSNTGEITLIEPLDYETNNTLNVIVSIEDENDRGEETNIVSLPITITILDENDQAPKFSKDLYEITVSEDTSPGIALYSDINVMDVDSPGQNLDISCINLPEYIDACNIFGITILSRGLNSLQAAIILKNEINYAEHPIIQFLLKASDGELSSTSQFKVIVNDIQDTPPKFKGPFLAEVKENAPINTLVMTIVAEDGDKGVPRKVVYEMVNNPMNYFLLDAVSGELRTSRLLDKESIENKDGKIFLSIKASELIDGKKGNDARTTTIVEIAVKIIDVNDEPPSFDRREYFVEVPESIKIGEAIPGLNMTVTDPDEENNSVFSLELDDPSGYFTIQPKQGVGSTKVKIKIVNNSLDYENPDQKKFVIYAVAKEIFTEEKLSSTATITITVTDVNDHSPVFDNIEYFSTIPETASPGSLVTTIIARDKDSGSFGSNGIIYHLEGQGAEKFSVNNRTGTITIAECSNPGSSKCLDYETKPVYILRFVATDDNGKGRNSSVSLRISLADTNDNAPVFSKPLYQVFINEGAVTFDPEFVIEAKDSDSSSKMTYSIISGNRNDIFNINPSTGKMGIRKGEKLEVSRESGGGITLTVMATDGKFTSTVPVNITVIDINNNAPIFTRENYVESIPEDINLGSIVTSLQATDADTGPNSLIEYLIQNGDSDFAIDNATGLITVASKLDYDRKNLYKIEVIARDHGEPILTGSTTLTINIINMNDKIPYFKPTTQKAEIMEDAPIGTLVHNLTAWDPDINSTDALYFESTEPITALDKYGNQVLFNDAYRDFFYVDKYTGQVKVKNTLQRNVAATVRLTVRVSDITASTVQQGEGILIITIGDVNDSPPKFLPPWSLENPIYNLDLEEEQPIGTVVSTFKATDEDSEISSYSIMPPSEYFDIDNLTGVVHIKTPLDYEQMQSTNFTIFAFDSGVPKLNTSATVLVNIINLNDNTPEFLMKSYKVTVPENSPNGTVILVVKATDSDIGDYGKVTYSLVGEYSKYFGISPDKGIIYITNTEFLDHEARNSTVIEVVANDEASPPQKRSVAVPVYIDIMDINDNDPVFNQSVYNVTIMENVRLNPPMPLMQVNATDLDSGLNGNIHFSIIDGNDDDIFLLGIETGILYPHKPLQNQKREFKLLIEARDGAGNGAKFDRATINIKVLNVNDHKPNFIMPSPINTTIEIAENNAVENYLVLTVKAVDEDEGENGRLTYHLKKGEEIVQETEEFVIDENNGELRTKIALDRERKSKYELILVARDHGNPIWFETEQPLSILLVDMNDNRPEFLNNQTYHFYVTENNEIPTKIGKIEAIDKDEGNYATVYYHIIMESDPGVFFVNQLDGTIFANISFDREEKDEYVLLILANNDPEFYLSPEDRLLLTMEELMTDSSIAKIMITVNDLNDNPPVFKQSVYYSAINAMANSNEFIAQVDAYDLDYGVNGSITYYIKASNLYKHGSNISAGSIIPSPFNISQNGEIFTTTHLTENNQHKFIIDIIVRENAFPEREALAKIHVWIFEPQQLIKIILSRPIQEVTKEQDEIISELSNSTESLVVIDKIKSHVDVEGNENKDWSDMYILVIDPKTQVIRPVSDVLKMIDSKYDFLKNYYNGYAIANVVPALVMEEEEIFNTSLAAFIALLMVIFVGILTLIVICCCLRNWVISSSDIKKQDILIKKTIIDESNITDNPLWIEQKLKIYEEQELTMQVFNESDQNGRNEREEYIPDENAYATIQHPNRRGSIHHVPAMSLSDEIPDYATLPGNNTEMHQDESSHDSLHGVPKYYEAAMGFQGSTFQVPERYLNNSDYETYRMKTSDITNQKGVQG